MKVLVRILIIFLAVEAIVCGPMIVRRLMRHEAVLPSHMPIDPLLVRDLEALALQTESGEAVDWLAYAEALLGQGFYGEAEIAFRRTIECDPETNAAQFGLAFCLDRTGRMEQSIAAYNAATELVPDPTRIIGTREHALYAVGRNHLRLEDTAAAEAIFESLDDFAPADYQRAKLMIRSGRAAQALPIITASLEKVPLSLGFNSLKLQAMNAEDRPEEALQAADDLQRSSYVIPLNFNTNYVEPMSQAYGIGAMIVAYNQLLMQGNREALPDKLNQILEAVGDRPLPYRQHALTSLAEVALGEQDAQGILQPVERLKELGEQNADMLQLEGAALALKGQPDEAAVLWLRASQMSPNIRLHQKLAAYFDQKDDAARQSDHRGQQQLLTVKMSYWGNKPVTARKAARRATRLSPNEPQAWFYLGEVERQLGDEDAASEAYTRCLQANPNHGRALKQMKRLSD